MTNLALLDLTGTRALITGGSRGVGAATAVMMAGAGARVAITFRERRDRADAVAESIKRSTGNDVVRVHADLSDADSIRDAVEQAAGELGGLEAFVANAGIWPPDDVPLSEMEMTRWSRTLRINLDGTFLGCREAVRRMDHGSIVVVGSTAGQRGEAYHADYAASKGAVQSFVKSLAVELAPRIRVNCVAPGWIDTEMAASSYADGGAERIAATIPMGRVASPEDVAGPIAFLCSDLARHVTGEVLNINGGSVLCG